MAGGQVVVAGIAAQHVVEIIAGGIDIGTAEQSQVFDIGWQAVADAGLDGVSSFVDPFADPVANIVDDKNIVAGAAFHAICAAPTSEAIIAGRAAQGVGSDIAKYIVADGIASRVNRGAAGQHECLDLRAHGPGGAGLRLVRATTRTFQRHIRRTIDDVEIIALAAGHGVLAGATIETISAVAAVQDVIACCTPQYIVSAIAEQTIGAGITEQRVAKRTALHRDAEASVAQHEVEHQLWLLAAPDVFKGDVADAAYRQQQLMGLIEKRHAGDIAVTQ